MFFITDVAQAALEMGSHRAAHVHAILRSFGCVGFWSHSLGNFHSWTDALQGYDF